MFSLFTTFRKLSSEAIQAAKRVKPKSKPKKKSATKKSKKSKTRSEATGVDGIAVPQPIQGKIGGF
jgi:hypothetical protein